MLAGGLSAPPVLAHQPDPTVVVVLDEVVPPLPGTVQVEVARSVADQLVVSNDSSEVLEVLAETGEAFLRIGPAGVEADLASPSWYTTSSPVGALPAGAPAAPGRSRYATVSRESAWGWFDHRLHPADVRVPADVRGGRSRARLADWEVPMRLGGQPLLVRGHVEFRPVLGVVRTRLTTRALPKDLTLQVLDGRVPGLFARYTGATELHVLGRSGEPFARLSESGTDVNSLSPTYLDDQRLRGRAISEASDADAPPRWLHVSDTPTLSWLDRRLAYESEVPPEVQRGGRVDTLLTWRLSFGPPGAHPDVLGVTEWVPLRQGGKQARRSRALLLVTVGVLAVGLTAAAVVVRRRRGTTVHSG